MKGNKMITILAIVLMLSGALFVTIPMVRAAPRPAAAVVANVLPDGGNDNYTGNGPFVAYPFKTFENITGHSPGYHFWVYIDVINVTGLYTYQVGFTFNSSVLQVNNVTGPGQYTEVNRKKIFPSYNWFLSSASAITGNATAALIKMNANVTGKVTAEGYYCSDPTTAENGSGLLMQVCFCINPSFAASYTGKFPGSPVSMMNFSLTEKDIQLLMVWTDGKTQLQPPQSGCYNGTVLKESPARTIPPKYSGVTRSASYAGSACTFSITWQGINPLSKYIFSFDNGVGYFTNDTAKAFVSNPQTVSSTKILIAKVGATVRYKWYANDTSGNWNSTAIQTFVTIGSPPTYSSISYSTARAGASCVFSITCSDRLGLSKYIFSFDNGVGVLTNSTAASFTSNPQTISVTETLTATVGATIRFRWFFNDTLSLWNSTAVQSFVTTRVSVLISPASAVLDLGQSQTFTSTVSGGSPPYSYQWYLNGTKIHGANSSAWTFKPLSMGAYNVYLNVTDAKGTIGVSNIATIAVNSPPGIEVSPSTVTLDIGEAWLFVASTFNGTPPYSSYQWYLDGSPVINATSETWTYTPLVLVNRTIYITAFDSKGVECTSNMVSVTVGAAMKPGISPLSVAMDLGMSQLYTVNVSGGTPPYSYQWYQWFPSGSQQFVGANKTTLYFTPSFAGLDLVYAEITDSLGIKVDVGAEATVNPTISASISPSSAKMDAGQPQTFDATVSGGEAPYSYQWILNGTIVLGATSSSWTFVPAAAGVYEVSVNVTDAFKVSALSSNSSATVNPPPAILVSPGSVALDVGESWTFRASISNGTPPYSSYQWYLDGSPVVGAVNSTWTYTALSLANRTIYVTASDSFNFEAVSNKVSVLVSSAMNPTISPLTATLDLGQSQTYTLKISGGTPPYSYQWYQWFSNGCTPFAGATNATFTFTPPAIGFNIIYVVVTDSLGVKVDWGATATVNPQPSAVVLPKSVTMDIGMSQQFASTVVNGTPPYSYQWYLDGSPVSGATNATWTYTANMSSVGTHKAYLVVTDSVNFAVSSNNVTITVNPPLAASISPKSAVTDPEVPVTFTSNITGGMAPYSCQWYLNGSTILGAVKTSYTLTPPNAGTYYISLMATDFFDFAASSNTATVLVNPLPTVTLSPTSVSLQLGQNQTFTATVKGGTPSYVYYWYVNGVLAAKTTVSTYTFTPATLSTYYKLYVTVSDIYGLNATSNTAIINGHDVAVTEVVPVDNVRCPGLKTVFGKGYPIAVNITAADPGYYTETFTVTAYANTTAIASHNVTLPSGGSTVITLNATANLAYGYYTISAYASPVTGEVNLANNRVANSTMITVTVPGDVNGDGVDNILDISLIAANWLQTVPPGLGNADANGDGVINIMDISLVAVNWLSTVNL